MKKILSFVLSALFAVSLCSCKRKPYYESADDITITSINEMTVPEKMADYKGAVEIDRDITYSGSEINIVLKYAKDGSIYRFSQYVAAGGSEQYSYTSTDESDAVVYTYAGGSYYTDELDENIAETVFEDSYTSYTEYSEITDITEENGTYTVKISNYANEILESYDTLTIDAQSGFIQTLVCEFADGSYTENAAFTYTKDGTVDMTAKGGSARVTGTLSFSTTDINGKTQTAESLTDGAKVVMVNFWEPWCSPCVNEIPELEKLYENYKDEGLVIIGVYSTEDGASDIVSENGVTYPVILYTDSLSAYTSDYVPTTVFFDENGNYIENSQVIGANDYSGWESLVESYLNPKG